MIHAICIELVLKKEYLAQNPIGTIYFGGGTPSLLTDLQLSTIFDCIHLNYSVLANAEITLEANPEDISSYSLLSWQKCGVNRLSIGIQSFQDPYLKWMNRNHSSQDALKSVMLAKEYGFENISIDLIYGLPGLTLLEWEKEIEIALNLGVTHISSYALTVEERTLLGSQVDKGVVQLNSEEVVEQQMLYLISRLTQTGFEQYEISNFCKPTFESKHNSSYWKQSPYIGVGPGAHSYNNETRQFNINNNALYIKHINKPESGKYFTIEELSQIDHYNEYILTRIRTKWGISLYEMGLFIPREIIQLSPILDSLSQNGLLKFEQDLYKLTTKGKLLADEITLKLML